MAHFLQKRRQELVRGEKSHENIAESLEIVYMGDEIDPNATLYILCTFLCDWG